MTHYLKGYFKIWHRFLKKVDFKTSLTLKYACFNHIFAEKVIYIFESKKEEETNELFKTLKL